MYTLSNILKHGRDRSPIKTVHLQFCNRYLEMNNKASYTTT